MHDRSGNVIAELNASGSTVREYVWLPEAEIAPTAASRAPIDRPVAVVDGVNATPTLYYVHTDHLHRPVKMSDGSKAMVWQAEYQPWGAVQSLSGPLTLDLRFPGQWFQLEAGLHYNWHRHYDPGLGRYTQPDPLGFVDGPSVYGYARGNPYRYVDPKGQQATAIAKIIPGLCTLGLIEPTPLGEIACACAIGAAALFMSPKPDACQKNSCMADRPRGFWAGDKGAEEWGRRNNVPPDEARRRFHEKKQDDSFSGATDDYSVDPETGDIADPEGEIIDNLG